MDRGLGTDAEQDVNELAVRSSANSLPDTTTTGEVDASLYVAFILGDEEYCIDVMTVREIRGWTKATKIPNTPAEILGVVNLRGAVIPIMDMRTHFGMGRTEVTQKHVVIIIELEDQMIGILVDAVSDILTVSSHEIQPVDSFETSSTRTGALSHVVARADRIIGILSPDKLLSDKGLDAIADATRQDPKKSGQAALKPDTVALVQESFKKVIPISDAAADIFYDRLFEIAPQARALFPNDLKEQKKKLMKMIAMAVTNLHKAETIVPALRELGKRHVGYGAEDAHYDLVGQALLDTLAQGLGDEFTPNVKAAWGETYELVASVMKNAAASAEGR